MSDIWYRINAQRDLRENVRVAIKAAGMTQRAAAEAAGIKPSRLHGFLSSNVWIEPVEAHALSVVTNVSLEELQGGSVYRHDPRVPEFESRPDAMRRKNRRWEVATQGQPGQNRERALCCECGALRLWNTNICGATYVGDLEPDGRMLKTLKCETCNQHTRHALLRAGAHKDVAEERDHAPVAAARSARERDDLINRMRGFNVAVEFRRIKPAKRTDTVPIVGIEYDDSKSQWRFEVNPAAPAVVQLEVLRRTWSEVASGKFSDEVTWDPTKDGILDYATDTSWNEATDELVTDLARFVDVERRRMVQGINGEAGRREFRVDESEAS